MYNIATILTYLLILLQGLKLHLWCPVYSV